MVSCLFLVSPSSPTLWPKVGDGDGGDPVDGDTVFDVAPEALVVVVVVEIASEVSRE